MSRARKPCDACDFLVSFDPRYDVCRFCGATRPHPAPKPWQPPIATATPVLDRIAENHERYARERRARQAPDNARRLREYAARLYAACQREGKPGERARARRDAMLAMAQAWANESFHPGPALPTELKDLASRAAIEWLVMHETPPEHFGAAYTAMCNAGIPDDRTGYGRARMALFELVDRWSESTEGVALATEEGAR